MAESEKENAFYEAHKAEFHEKYLNKWLVITGESLVGVYDTFAEAANAALKLPEQEGIMIHRPADDGMVIEFGPFISVSHPDETEEPESTVTCTEGELVKIPYAY